MPNPLNYKVVCWRVKEGDFLLLKRICTTHGTYCQIPLLILTIGTPSALAIWVSLFVIGHFSVQRAQFGHYQT